MSLKFTILGWLSTAPGSGYDLVRQLDQGLHWFWAAPHSQIYSTLRALENEGLVTSRAETVGTKLEKRVYEITAPGREAVRAWSEEPPEYPPSRDAERLKLIFGDHGDLKALRRHLETHRDHFTERRDTIRRFLGVLNSREHPRIELRVERGRTEAHQELTLELRRLAYRGDVRRAEHEISWAEEALDWLDSFEARWGSDLTTQ
ncbi:PadR family transcriptional regulator [Streptomyces sp. NPDC101455]|uniref:PadR family transcriptional regulator n=1 Tax=Streptomyces sp. NPDC101455 TaxID=3366142 RepID=UPI00380D68D2